MSFYVNDILWNMEYVDPYDLNLVDKDGVLRLATTDPNKRVIFLSNRLSGDKKVHVLIHELGHCIIFSYGLHKVLHKYVKHIYWDEAEEALCNFIADYGREILYLADKNK